MPVSERNGLNSFPLHVAEMTMGQPGSFNNITGPFWQSSLDNEKALYGAVLLLKVMYL